MASVKWFGHACKPKVEEQTTNNDDTWRHIGKASGGGGGVLEALTKEVPNASTGDAFVMQSDKEGVVMEDLGDESQSETTEELGEIPTHTTTSSCSAPSLVKQAPQSIVDVVTEKDQIAQGAARDGAPLEPSHTLHINTSSSNPIKTKSSVPNQSSEPVAEVRESKTEEGSKPLLEPDPGPLGIHTIQGTSIEARKHQGSWETSDPVQAKKGGESE